MSTGTSRRPGTEPLPLGERIALTVLFLATAVLYLWDLGGSGYANSFYSAAVQAGSQSWKAMFFGSFDASNAITVDKPPAALWVMSLSVRIFGLGSWAILVPHYIAGGRMGGGRANGDSSASSEIATWVQENFTAQTVGGVTVHDLTSR